MEDTQAVCVSGRGRPLGAQASPNEPVRWVPALYSKVYVMDFNDGLLQERQGNHAVFITLCNITAVFEIAPYKS